VLTAPSPRPTVPLWLQLCVGTDGKDAKSVVFRVQEGKVRICFLRRPFNYSGICEVRIELQPCLNE